MKAFVVAILLLAGCGPGEDMSGTCDYCHVRRSEVWRNKCDVCGKAHLSCLNERSMWVSHWGPPTINACPKEVPGRSY